jgi:predicted HicB family RNase H-like nuclease
LKPDNREQLKIRLQPKLRRLLDRAAESRGISTNREITRRLEASIRVDPIEWKSA